jgi:Kae1-associated kinase Bud32
MKIICRGAESIIYTSKWEDQKVLVKERIKKGYRIEQIDEKLRKFRTSKETKLLTEARKISVSTPKIFEVDKDKCKITMEFIQGKRIKELLKTADKEIIKKICFEIGRSVGKLHSSNIVHGDLTTSNMILRNDKIYFIDFGLGKFSKRIEDFGVDLNLLYEALKSTHFKILKICWNNILKGYKKEYKDAKEVLKKVEEIEKRARYVKR